MARHQRVQVVARLVRVELARELDGAKNPAGVTVTGAPELVAEEPVVEAGVVRDEQLAVQTGQQRPGDLGEGGGERHHVVGDARDGLDRRRNPDSRVHQCGPLGDAVARPDLDQADFGDAVINRMGAGGLEVEENEGLV
ncbi:hypothetical protein D3C83_22790 [compost metagenome]